MEDFNLGKIAEDDNPVMDMSVSQICLREGKKVAYVTFTEGKRRAEGEIPDCKITSSEGFNETEIAGLEFYMKANLSELKKMAASIRTLDAIVGKDE